MELTTVGQQFHACQNVFGADDLTPSCLNQLTDLVDVQCIHPTTTTTPFFEESQTESADFFPTHLVVLVVSLAFILLNLIGIAVCMYMFLRRKVDNRAKAACALEPVLLGPVYYRQMAYSQPYSDSYPRRYYGKRDAREGYYHPPDKNTAIV